MIMYNEYCHDTHVTERIDDAAVDRYFRTSYRVKSVVPDFPRPFMLVDYFTFDEYQEFIEKSRISDHVIVGVDVFRFDLERSKELTPDEVMAYCDAKFMVKTVVPLTEKPYILTYVFTFLQFQGFIMDIEECAQFIVSVEVFL